MLSGIHHVKLPVSDVRSQPSLVPTGSSASRPRSSSSRTVSSKESPCDATAASLKSLCGTTRTAPGPCRDSTPSRSSCRAGTTYERWSAQLDDLGEPHGGLVQGHEGGAVLVGLHDPDGIEIRLYAD